MPYLYNLLCPGSRLFLLITSVCFYSSGNKRKVNTLMIKLTHFTVTTLSLNITPCSNRVFHINSNFGISYCYRFMFHIINEPNELIEEYIITNIEIRLYFLVTSYHININYLHHYLFCRVSNLLTISRQILSC